MPLPRQNRTVDTTHLAQLLTGVIRIMAAKTERILFSGRVQGVGFRWTTEKIARNYPVTGFVRNLMTGQVEMIVRGESATVEELISAICDRFQANIETIEREDRPEQTEFSDFRILR